MSDSVESTTAPILKKRFRSPPYPSIPLAKAVERVTEMYPRALHHDVPLEVLADAWGYSLKSGGLLSTASALTQFGLIFQEGSGQKRRYRVTESAIRIIQDPFPNSEKCRAAKARAALNPKIHNELWEKFRVAGVSGSMDATLKSFLTVDRMDAGEARYSSTAADELIEEYKQTIAFAGLTESSVVSSDHGDDEDTDNLLLNDKSEEIKEHQHFDDRKLPPHPPADVGELNDIKAEIFGGRVRINALMNLEGLERLEKNIAAYKILLASDYKKNGNQSG